MSTSYREQKLYSLIHKYQQAWLDCFLWNRYDVGLGVGRGINDIDIPMDINGLWEMHKSTNGLIRFDLHLTDASTMVVMELPCSCNVSLNIHMEE